MRLRNSVLALVLLSIVPACASGNINRRPGVSTRNEIVGNYDIVSAKDYKMNDVSAGVGGQATFYEDHRVRMKFIVEYGEEVFSGSYIVDGDAMTLDIFPEPVTGKFYLQRSGNDLRLVIKLESGFEWVFNRK